MSLAFLHQKRTTTVQEPASSKDLLRLATAGSVDDGKSTLIGRLLYDSQSIYEDQLQAVNRASAGRVANGPDLSLLTDGLRAEREQGITIDVAYRYFSTARRKFILSDTPGHEQYTRNMATGASTADIAILLLDARKGVLQQSRRHAYIASLLGITKLIITVNKMDLVSYSRARFTEIKEQFTPILEKMTFQTVHWVPISALAGDNVVRRSEHMIWFDEKPLLELLETIPVPEAVASGPFRFPVQGVARPNQDFRGYHGQVASGRITPGDPVMVLPAGHKTHVESITTYDGELDSAFAPMSITLTLGDDIDISRGDVIVSGHVLPHISQSFRAALIWFDERPLRKRWKYLIKHGTQLTRAEITTFHFRVDINTYAQENAETLAMNEIGEAEITTAQPLIFDSYRENRRTGCAILIDPETNSTAGAVLLIAPARKLSETSRRATSRIPARLSAEERTALTGHHSVLIDLTGREAVAYRVERWLLERHCRAVVLTQWNETTANVLLENGFIVLCIASPAAEAVISVPGLPEGEQKAAEKVLDHLIKTNVLISHML